MKEKHQKIDSKKETMFYFEAIGFILIILTIVVVAELGALGHYLTIFFKILFGDWYLLFIFIIFVLGTSNILSHTAFDFRNQRFIGYVICVIGLLMLAHFPVHNYVLSQQEIDSSTTSYISYTISHYKNFAVTNSDTVLGGGIIGGLFFFVFFLMLGKIGVILISIIIVFLGITMIVNRSMKEIVFDIGNKFKKIGSMSKSFNNFFKYEIGKKEIRTREFNLLKKVNLKNFEETKEEDKIDYVSLEKDAFEYKNIIKEVLSKLRLDFKENEYHIMYAYTVFSYVVYSSFDCKMIGEHLSSLMKEELYIFKNNNNLYIEIENKKYYSYNVYDILAKQENLKDNYLIPLGFYYENEILDVDISKNGSFLICGDKFSGVKNFISYFVYAHYVKVDPSLYEFYLYDKEKEFEKFKKLFKEIYNSDINALISIIQNNIDSRYMLFRERHVKNIDEYNYSFDSNEERMKKYLKKLNYIIYLNDDNNHSELEDKIIYFLQSCKEVGINIIFVSRNIINYSTIFISSFEKRIIFSLRNAQMSKLCLDSSYACVLKAKGEAIFYRNGLKRRIQCPKLIVNNE